MTDKIAKMFRREIAAYKKEVLVGKYTDKKLGQTSIRIEVGDLEDLVRGYSQTDFPDISKLVEEKKVFSNEDLLLLVGKSEERDLYDFCAQRCVKLLFQESRARVRKGEQGKETEYDYHWRVKKAGKIHNRVRKYDKQCSNCKKFFTKRGLKFHRPYCERNQEQAKHRKS